MTPQTVQPELKGEDAMEVKEARSCCSSYSGDESLLEQRATVSWGSIAPSLQEGFYDPLARP